MAFLVWDQNQGIRNDRPARKRAGIATVLFHPDFNRRLRNCTESADPSLFGEGARGLGSPSFRDPYRRWGLSPRPENASIFRQSGNRFAVENAPIINLRAFWSQNRYPLLRNARTIQD